MTTPDAFVVREGTTGSFVATDSITTGLTTSHYQYVKLAFGQDGTATLVDTASGKHLPVQLYSGGSAISSTSNKLDVNLSGSGITLNTRLGGTFGNFQHVGIEGITASMIPVMISGTTAIGGAVPITGIGTSAGANNFLFVSGFEGATALGITNATPLDIRKLTASFAGATFTGDVVGVTGTVAINDTSFIGITTKDGALDTRILTAAFAGSTFTGDVVGITGEVKVTSNPNLTASFAGATFTGDVVGVTGALQVSSTDLDIRGLTFGHHVSADGITAATLTDGVVAKGISGGFPVNTFIRGIDSVNGLPAGVPIGACGDALRVHVTNAGVSIAATFNANLGVFNATTDFLAVSGSSAHHRAILVEGTAGGEPVGVTWPLRAHVGVTTETPLEVTISNTHGISGFFSGGAAGTYTGNFIGVTGAVFVGNASLGVTTADGPFDIRALSAGYTGWGAAAGGTTGLLSGDIVGVTGAVEIYAPGITNVSAMQIQGRADGATVNPIAVIGTLKTDASSGIVGVIGVTFAQSATHAAKQIVIGEGVTGSDNTLKTLIHGVSNDQAVAGSTAHPIALKRTASGDYAMKVAIEDATLTATISDTNLTVANTTSDPLPIQGSDAGKLGVYVTGTGGTVGQWPLLVSGYNPEGISAADNIHPIGVTSEYLSELVGISGGLVDIALNTAGITSSIVGITAAINDIHNQTNIAQAVNAIGNVGNDGTLVSNMKSIIDFINDTFKPTIDETNDKIAVSVSAPTIAQTDQAIASATRSSFTNSNALTSGIRIKLPSTATGNVFVGGTDTVSATNGYLLMPGDDVFIEIDNMTRIGIVAETENETVYAIGS